MVIQRDIIQSKEGKNKTYNSKRIERTVLIEEQKAIILLKGTKKSTINRHIRGKDYMKTNRSTIKRPCSQPQGF